MKALLVIFILLSLQLYAQPLFIQQLKKEQTGWGKVMIHSQTETETIIDQHITVNQKAKGIPGYRIQVFFASGNEAKHQANKLRIELRELFPSYETYLVYEEPFFKVKIGDFRTKLEAYKLFREIQASYPSAFIIEDLVSYENLP